MQTVPLAICRALESDGSRMEMSRPMMAMTTSSSIRVNARVRVRIIDFPEFDRVPRERPPAVVITDGLPERNIMTLSDLGEPDGPTNG